MSREYLAAHGVQAALASAVCEVLRTRPADPILGIRDILLAKEAAKTNAMMDAPPAKEPMKLAAQSCFEVPYELRFSLIAGRGIFATAPIARGTRVWRYEVGVNVLEHDEASLRKRLAGVSADEALDLLEHVYSYRSACVDDPPCVIEILDDGKVWNHAPDHNTGNHPDGTGDGVSSYARRDIAAGEELTDDYGTFDEIPWYETICIEYGATSCVRVGREHR